MSGTYKVAVISGERKLEVVEKDLKKPEGRQVLVKIQACAICTLEQRIYAGSMKRYPFAGGHEMAGYVVEVGEKVSNIKPGDKVAMRMLTACGECYYCRSGHENQCLISFKAATHEGLNGPGGFSEYMMVDSTMVYKFSDDIDYKYAALTEPLACCVHSVKNANIQLSNDVVVIGVGIMGAFHIMLAKLCGARVIACEIDNDRLELAKKLGADIVINTKETDGIEEIKSLTEGRGADVVFCTVANATIAANSIAMAGKLGRVVFYSSFHPDLPINFNPNSIHYSEIIVTGSVNPGMKDFLTASRLLSKKIINPSLIISGELPFERIEEAFEMALDPKTFRIIVKM
ncbi:MAG: sorbitol dehydrogenase [Clostridia bacterium BRH_c25]|nr:MAG: sorbitol dehydrogenase [Clostridia bacterium BRH_c25]